VALRAAARLCGIEHEHAVTRDREQPGPHRRAASEPRQIAEYFDEDLLLYVIG